MSLILAQSLAKKRLLGIVVCYGVVLRKAQPAQDGRFLQRTSYSIFKERCIAH